MKSVINHIFLITYMSPKRRKKLKELVECAKSWVNILNKNKNWGNMLTNFLISMMAPTVFPIMSF